MFPAANFTAAHMDSIRTAEPFITSFVSWVVGVKPKLLPPLLPESHIILSLLSPTTGPLSLYQLSKDK